MGDVNCMGADRAARWSRAAAATSCMMASLTGYVGLPTAASYGATKAALISDGAGLQAGFRALSASPSR